MSEAGHEEEYNDGLIAMLELIWGEGFLSPGGPEAVRAIVAGLDLTGMLAIDVGCGIGGPALTLARAGADQVIGLDVETGVVARAVARVSRAGLGDRVTIRRFEPGRLPFDDASVDLVFGKDAWIHVPDKQAFFAEAFRVLRPGGWLAAGDWLRGPGPVSEEMDRYVALEDLSFHMATLEAYGAALAACGFEEIKLEDIAEDYRRMAHDELEQLAGPLRARLAAAAGVTDSAHQIKTWGAMTVVLDKGELRPSRFRGRKPA